MIPVELWLNNVLSCYLLLRTHIHSWEDLFWTFVGFCILVPDNLNYLSKYQFSITLSEFLDFCSQWSTKLDSCKYKTFIITDHIIIKQEILTRQAVMFLISQTKHRLIKMEGSVLGEYSDTSPRYSWRVVDIDIVKTRPLLEACT